MPFGRKEEKRNRQITKKKEEIQKYNHLRLDLYEDYKDGLITKEEYLELKEIYEKRTQAAEQVLEAMEEAASGRLRNEPALNLSSIEAMEKSMGL